MNALFQLEGALRHLPEFDAGFLHGEEINRVSQVHLSKMAVAVRTVDGHLASRSVVKWIGQRGLTSLAVQYR